MIPPEAKLLVGLEICRLTPPFRNDGRMTQDIPPDFRRLTSIDKVSDCFMPLFAKPDGEAGIALGFRVGPEHCNPRGVCHGGTWATLADVLMGVNVALVTGLSGPTVSMSLDFLGPAGIGKWVEGSARILRRTPKLGFADCVFTADGEMALRASAVFRRKNASFESRAVLLASKGGS